jgi:hypothetical protein
MHRPLVRSLLVCAALAGCDAAAPLDAGHVDAPEPLDAALDAFGDASRDAAVTDARLLDAPVADAPRFDGGRDAPGPRPDAGPEVAAAVAQALDLVCGVPARAACSAPWLCGCDTSSPPPFDLAACERSERTECEARLRDTLTAFFARGGVTVDEEALATCTALAEQSYQRCLPRPVSDEDQPASCWDAFVLGTAVGSPCDVSGVRCADGAGVCAGRVCTAAGDAVGARCFGTCTAGLVCAEGTCADPVAASGACSDHEDCAASELCVGGRCEAPVPVGRHLPLREPALRRRGSGRVRLGGGVPRGEHHDLPASARCRRELLRRQRVRPGADLRHRVELSRRVQAASRRGRAVRDPLRGRPGVPDGGLLLGELRAAPPSRRVVRGALRAGRLGLRGRTWLRGRNLRSAPAAR